MTEKKTYSDILGSIYKASYRVVDCEHQGDIDYAITKVKNAGGIVDSVENEYKGDYGDSYEDYEWYIEFHCDTEKQFNTTCRALHLYDYITDDPIFNCKISYFENYIIVDGYAMLVDDCDSYFGYRCKDGKILCRKGNSARDVYYDLVSMQQDKNYRRLKQDIEYIKKYGNPKFPSLQLIEAKLLMDKKYDYGDIVTVKIKDDTFDCIIKSRNYKGKNKYYAYKLIIPNNDDISDWHVDEHNLLDISEDMILCRVEESKRQEYINNIKKHTYEFRHPFNGFGETNFKTLLVKHELFGLGSIVPEPTKQTFYENLYNQLESIVKDDSFEKNSIRNFILNHIPEDYKYDDIDAIVEVFYQRLRALKCVGRGLSSTPNAKPIGKNLSGLYTNEIVDSIDKKIKGGIGEDMSISEIIAKYNCYITKFPTKKGIGYALVFLYYREHQGEKINVIPFNLEITQNIYRTLKNKYNIQTNPAADVLWTYWTKEFIRYNNTKRSALDDDTKYNYLVHNIMGYWQDKLLNDDENHPHVLHQYTKNTTEKEYINDINAYDVLINHSDLQKLELQLLNKRTPMKNTEKFKVGDIVYYTLKKQHTKDLALLANINDNNYIVYDITPTNTGGYKIYNINKHFPSSKEMLSSVNKDLQDKIKKALGEERINELISINIGNIVEELNPYKLSGVMQGILKPIYYDHDKKEDGNEYGKSRTATHELLKDVKAFANRLKTDLGLEDYFFKNKNQTVETNHTECDIHLIAPQIQPPYNHLHIRFYVNNPLRGINNDYYVRDEFIISLGAEMSFGDIIYCELEQSYEDVLNDIRRRYPELREPKTEPQSTTFQSGDLISYKGFEETILQIVEVKNNRYIVRELGDRTRTQNEIPFADNEKLQRAVSPLMAQEILLIKDSISPKYKKGDFVVVKTGNNMHLDMFVTGYDPKTNFYILMAIKPHNHKWVLYDDRFNISQRRILKLVDESKRKAYINDLKDDEQYKLIMNGVSLSGIEISGINETLVKQNLMYSVIPEIDNNSGYELDDIPDNINDRKTLLEKKLLPLVDVKRYCRGIREFIDFQIQTIREIKQKASQSKESTLAALNLCDVIIAAKYIHKSKDLGCRIKGLGVVKLGVQPETNTVYYITKYQFEQI